MKVVPVPAPRPVVWFGERPTKAQWDALDGLGFMPGPSVVLGEHLYDDLAEENCDVKHIAYCLSAIARLRDWPCNVLVIGNGDQQVLNQVTGYQPGPCDWWGRAERDPLSGCEIPVEGWASRPTIYIWKDELGEFVLQG